MECLNPFYLIPTQYRSLGRVATKSPKSSYISKAAAQNRANRRNNAKQGQKKKRQELMSATRIFNGVDGAPRIVAVIPLSPDVEARGVVSNFADSLDLSAGDCPEIGLWKMKYVLTAEHTCILLFTPIQSRAFQNFVTIHQHVL